MGCVERPLAGRRTDRAGSIVKRRPSRCLSFPNLAKNMQLDGPNQLWVADITYVAIAIGFVYLAAILDAWSRRVVGYAISRSIDARLAVAALKAAIRRNSLGFYSGTATGGQQNKMSNQ